ncbi:pentatricopeptide repeat-containing protein At2g45350, chloroplastic-like [Macadamia integrifolia]|uniref:pentatricopeptide repeat-containing protein At2g45350, chloroplastic-like n=1 Tax=Macadamia integrifolia TaxID=60698 RepID=UPI001C4E7E3C|nr:pentatricopeptide repeat-containing protein At2g45350, chloroplastic-like [Macadamia integrifolia]
MVSFTCCHGSPWYSSDLRQWNLIIKHRVIAGDLEGAVLMFTKMQGSGVHGDNYTFPLVLKAAAGLAISHVGFPLHGQIIKTGFSFHVFVQTAMLKFYSALGYMDRARLLFDNMPEKDLLAWNSMLDAYASYGQMDDALEIFDLMPVSDSVSFNTIISGYRKIGRVASARDFFDRMLTKDDVSWNSMIALYTEAGEMKLARLLFDEMVGRNVVSWNTLINGYLQNQCYADAVDLFYRMKASRTEPDHLTLSAVLSACAHLHSLETGLQIHTDAVRFLSDLHVIAALVDMYSKCGSIEKALQVFYKAQVKNIYCWNAMISGLALHGYGQAALRLFEEMKAKSTRPDDITFIGLLSACSHAGMVQEGSLLFECMERDFGISPKAEHYGCIVDLLGRAGFLDQAYGLIETMPFEPEATVLGALLGACMIHGDLKMGELIAKRITARSDGLTDGEYMMLANIYAMCGQWQESNRWRRKMNDAGISKAAGCSLIEIDGKMHRFLAGEFEDV